MYDFVIVHGSFGNPYENWFPWLYKELKAKGYNVLVPDFPTPLGQNLDNWSNVLKAYDNLIGEKTTIIAHSIAPAFAVDYVIQNKKSIHGLICVAPFYGLINIEEFDQINSSFFLDSIKINDICKYTKYIHCLYSDNDPYVPLELSKKFVDDTSAKYDLIPNGEHLNASSGFSSFEKLINIIESNIES